jgi:hypothetical protein
MNHELLLEIMGCNEHSAKISEAIADFKKGKFRCANRLIEFFNLMIGWSQRLELHRNQEINLNYKIGSFLKAI